MELDSLINLLNNDKTVHGILVQLPLPKLLTSFLPYLEYHQ
ncbi:Methenyltetrahydrofolate cyclohydrolase [Candidatus Nitrosotalea sp. TS]|nr:Methenyltetrahydrofolate cyclohydrolase [Candidatus Nitrosotalea sp. TS]